MMMQRRQAPLANTTRKRISPEAYADFPIVPQAEIDVLRARMEPRMAEQGWEIVEDIAEPCHG